MSGLTLLHLGNQLLVEEALGAGMQGAVDGDDVALAEHLLERVDAAAANLPLRRGRERLVVEVEHLLEVKGLEAAQDALADAADGDGADHLVLQVVLALGDGGDVPAAGLDLLVRGHKVAHQHEDRHDDVLGHRDDVRARHLRHRDAAVGRVGRVQVDVVRPDPGRDGQLELLGLLQPLGREIAGVEAGSALALCRINKQRGCQ